MSFEATNPRYSSSGETNLLPTVVGISHRSTTMLSRIRLLSRSSLSEGTTRRVSPMSSTASATTTQGASSDDEERNNTETGVQSETVSLQDDQQRLLNEQVRWVPIVDEINHDQTTVIDPPLTVNINIQRARRATSPLSQSRVEGLRDESLDMQRTRRSGHQRRATSPTANLLHSPPHQLYTGRYSGNPGERESNRSRRRSRSARRPQQRKSVTQSIRDALNPDYNWPGKHGNLVAVRSKRSCYRRLFYAPNYRGTVVESEDFAPKRMAVCILITCVFLFLAIRIIVLLANPPNPRSN